MKVGSLPSPITSTHLLERAKQYRLAAAIADDQRDVEMFRDLAVTFEQLAKTWSSESLRASVH
jgi:hypothetical protein